MPIFPLLVITGTVMAASPDVAPDSVRPPLAQDSVRPALAAAPAFAVGSDSGGSGGSSNSPPAHLRFGIGADIAAVGAPGLFGLGVGLQARGGVQLSPWFALYYQPHAIGAMAVTGESSAGAIGAVFNSVNIELDLPVLQLGAGPSLDILWLADCGLGSLACGTSAGTYFGADLRAAIMLGPHGPGSHAGVALEANLHPTFIETNVLTTFTLGAAFELY